MPFDATNIFVLMAGIIGTGVVTYFGVVKQLATLTVELKHSNETFKRVADNHSKRIADLEKHTREIATELTLKRKGS